MRFADLREGLIWSNVEWKQEQSKTHARSLLRMCECMCMCGAYVYEYVYVWRAFVECMCVIHRQQHKSTHARDTYRVLH